MNRKMHHISTDLLETIRAERRRRRLSQMQLGELLDIPQSHLARIEAGRTDLRVSTLVEISRALDLELMLIPKRVAPAVRYLIESPHQPSTLPPKLVGNEPEDAEGDQKERE
jgi:transcriptional regulator with XRE-family HTH domain